MRAGERICEAGGRDREKEREVEREGRNSGDTSASMQHEGRRRQGKQAGSSFVL